MEPLSQDEARKLRRGKAPGLAQQPASRLRDPGNKAIAAIAWLCVLAAVGAALYSAHGSAPAAAEDGAQEPAVVSTKGPEAAASTLEPVAAEFRLAGQLAVGFAQMLKGDAGQAEKIFNGTMGNTLEREDYPGRLREAIVLGELAGAGRALEKLDTLDADLVAPNGGASAWDAEDLAIVRDIQTLRAFYAQGVYSGAAADRLRERHGWFGELVGPDGSSNPARSAALAAAGRKARGLLVIVGGGAGALVLGCVLLLVFFLGGQHNRRRYVRPEPGASVGIETVAVFLLLLFGVGFGLELVHAKTGEAPSLLWQWAVAPAVLWPLVRGLSLRRWRSAMGWHGSIVKEAFVGVLGYVAGLPVLLLGVAAAFAMVLVAGAFGVAPTGPPSNPVVQHAIGGGGLWQVFVLACVWAPVVEETVFRGAMHHHLRGRMGLAGTAVVTAVVFAAVHPYGVWGVPVLTALACVFSVLREWRGSVVAPMTAHALHNAMALSLAVWMMG